MRLTTSLFRRRALLAAPLAALGPSAPKPRQLACPTPCDDDCTATCHEDHQPPWKRSHDPARCAPDDPDAKLALSELQGQLARTQSACLRLAQQLDARYVRYAWTEQLAADLRAIAHDTMGR